MTTIKELAESRLERARNSLRECRLCPRNCGVDRTAGETGWCGVDADAHNYHDFIHYGEEAGLAPSYIINLTGCNLSCLYCYTAADRKHKAAAVLTAGKFQEMMRKNRLRGALNVNIIGGEPVVNLPAIIRLFAGAEDPLPLVWNTNAYCNPEALEMVFGLPAVYLADLKFGNPDCAARVSGAGDYWDVARSCIRGIYEREPEKLIVRHVVMPGHVECCAKPVLAWLARDLPGVRVNLLTNYLPRPAARSDAKLCRFLTPEEIARVGKIAGDLELEIIDRAAGRNPKNAGEEIYQEALARGGGEEKKPDVEIVISPDGRVFLPYPTREMMELSAAAINLPEGIREEKS